jgi:hypothetical protein
MGAASLRAARTDVEIDRVTAGRLMRFITALGSDARCIPADANWSRSPPSRL